MGFPHDSNLKKFLNSNPVLCKWTDMTPRNGPILFCRLPPCGYIGWIPKSSESKSTLYMEGHWDLAIMKTKMEVTILYRVQGLGSWGLSKRVNNGDKLGDYMGYRGYKPTY